MDTSTIKTNRKSSWNYNKWREEVAAVVVPTETATQNEETTENKEENSKKYQLKSLIGHKDINQLNKNIICAG